MVPVRTTTTTTAATTARLSSFMREESSRRIRIRSAAGARQLETTLSTTLPAPSILTRRRHHHHHRHHQQQHQQQQQSYSSQSHYAISKPSYLSLSSQQYFHHSHNTASSVRYSSSSSSRGINDKIATAAKTNSDKSPSRRREPPQQPKVRSQSSLAVQESEDDEDEEHDDNDGIGKVQLVELMRQEQVAVSVERYETHQHRPTRRSRGGGGAPLRPRLEALRKKLQQAPRDDDDDNEPTAAAALFSSPSGGCRSEKQQRGNGNERSKEMVEDPTAALARLKRTVVESIPDADLPSADRILVDRFRRKHTYLRISLTERCNLRCTYCMPEAGVPLQPPDTMLSTSEILALADRFVQSGVHKFRLTGGEPTLRRDLEDVIAGLDAFEPTEIGMTTNGVAVHKKLPALVAAGLTSLNVSLDTTDPELFQSLTRRPAGNLQRVWQTLDVAAEICAQQAEEAEALAKTGAATTGTGDPNRRRRRKPFSVKLNCVVMRGTNDDQLAGFLHLTRKYPALQVRFIEYMPFDSNGWNMEKFVSYKKMLSSLQTDHGIVLQPVRSPDPHDTTKWYTFDDGNNVSHNHSSMHKDELPMHQPRIGFITSMSDHFCADCNRLRLTADGQLKVCLFDGSSEISLRDALRAPDWTDRDLLKLIYATVQRKRFKLGGHETPQDICDDAANNRPMTLIGG